MSILVTGGAGFIGSNFVLDWLAQSDEPVITLDKLTYAGNIANLVSLKTHPGHIFVHGDIGDSALVASLLTRHQPRAILNFAAESHVDRSIYGPGAFIQTNIVGTFNLLEAAREYWNPLPEPARRHFRFLHVSTDEVYGSLDATAPAFTESSRYKPNSPYSASKAASDHLVRAYHHTYGLPVLTTNCSNNYGPYHFPEKLIPWLSIMRWPANPCPYTETASRFATGSTSGPLQRDTPGAGGRRARATYNVGGNNEKPIWMLCTPCANARRTPPAPRRPELQDADQLRRIGRATTVAMRSMPRAWLANWDGDPPRPLRPDCARPSSGTCRTRPGFQISFPGRTATGSRPTTRPSAQTARPPSPDRCP